MERVVYFLGAGFSAPLGLPVMSDFLMKSKDMYALQPENYGSFQDVFKTIERLSFAKNYYKADLFNIEEILSILEMRALLGEGQLKDSFINYISDVIEHHTPSIRGHEGPLPANWQGFLFGNPRAPGPPGIRASALYGYFVANLLGLTFHAQGMVNDPTRTRYSRTANRTTAYSVITVNYDLVLENYVEYIKDAYGKLPSDTSPDIELRKSLDWAQGIDINPDLAKLHGSVETKTIVPPTWNKAMGDDVMPSWRLAADLLSKANHIRMIGFSLPTADSYIKYLLKGAIIDTPHLKSIDVLCLDGDGSVKQRYDEFIGFYKYRFVSGSFVEFLETLVEQQVEFTSQAAHKPMNGLEAAHEQYFYNKTGRG